jgi:hypothetical protein
VTRLFFDRLFVVGILGLARVALAADPPPIPAFTADVELRAEGEVAQKWKLASFGDRVRLTPLGNTELDTNVVDVAGKRVWSYSSDGKQCEVIASKDPMAEVLGFPARGTKEEPAGEEKVSGIATRKVKVTTPQGETIFVWYAAELGDLPIRSLRPIEKVEVVYKKIERVKPDQKLHALPPSCPP